MARYSFTAKLWVWPGETASWRFVTVPKKESEDITSKITFRRGFGSVKVEVCIGNTTWKTSLFPDSKMNTYVLPVKAKVRHEESIDDGDTVRVNIKTIE